MGIAEGLNFKSSKMTKMVDDISEKNSPSNN